MKVLMAIRLYSSFEASISSGIWEPRGSTSIVLLIEDLLKSGNEVDLVLLGSSGGTVFTAFADSDHLLKGLACPVAVIAGDAAWPVWFGRFRYYVAETVKFLKLMRRIRATKPDVIYMDRGHVVISSLIARLQKVPVVLRLLGIPPETRREILGTSLFERLVRWSYQAPFVLVICSQDGTAPERWLDRMLAPDVARQIMMNGANLEKPVGPPPDRIADIPSERTIAVFLGRLDVGKQGALFVKAMLLAMKKCSHLHAMIVGSGPDEPEMLRLVEEAGREAEFSFVGALPHAEIAHAFDRCDIYVSLNYSGNFSNANLEAMKYGACIVVPPSDPESGVDEALDTLFPPRTLARLPKAYGAREVADMIVSLYRAPEQRAERATATATLAAIVIPEWQDRIAAETKLIRKIAEAELRPHT